MEALTNTNAPVAYDPIRYGREILRIPQGTKIEAKSELGKFIIDSTKKFNDQRMAALSASPQAPPQFMTVTNAEGRAIDILIKPNGEPMVIEPKVQNTQQGMYTMSNPTNAVPLIDPNTKQQLQGYAADPMMGGMPQPGIGGAGMAVTNAPTAAPVQTPAPSPTPAFVVEATPDEIRQRYPNAPANLVPGMTIQLKSGGVIVVK
jgi:hypothetical protein